MLLLVDMRLKSSWFLLDLSRCSGWHWALRSSLESMYCTSLSIDPHVSPAMLIGVKQFTVLKAQLCPM